MSLTPLYITSYNSGLVQNKKPFLIPDQAFQTLLNAYVWRDRVKKREGLKLMGRLRRILTLFPSAALQEISAPGAGTFTFNLFTLLGLLGTEPNAEVEPGDITNISIVISAPISQTLTDTAGTGILTIVGAGPITQANINYATGVLTLTFSGAAGASTITFTGAYYPGFPVMGIQERELSGINNEQAVYFDQKYAYTWNGNSFLQLGTATWSGTDSDFFWTTNYRGIEPSSRLFFATNFVNNAANPIRYFDSAWNDFEPLIGGTPFEEILGTLVTPWMAFAGNLTQSPIIEGSVVIIVENTEDEIVFRDTPEDGTLVAEGLNTGTINYATGAITLTLNPAFEADATVRAKYLYGSSFLFQARVIIPYYGRLLALNTWEGTSRGSAQNIFNRCRFSQVGNPLELDAWRSDEFGKGGFIDAPVSEEITSATFYKNTLIVFFEQTTWQLRYVGEYGLPFIWERISSDFGSESTFSPILFDQGVLAVGDKAIVSSSGVDVQRIDLDIPDTIFGFSNTNNGVKRVQGVRDFYKELAHWCYRSSQHSTNYFPDTTLLFNYRNNTWAQFRNNVTAFGTQQQVNGITWDRDDILWDDPTVFWDDADNVKLFPRVVCGNQQGFVHEFQATQMDEPSLSITAIDLTVSPIRITVPNHNIYTNEYIFITGLEFLDSTLTTVLPTNLNNRVYKVITIDEDTLDIYQWNQTAEDYILNYDFTPVTTAVYIGNGRVSLLPKLLIRTKDFNPFQSQGKQVFLSYVDFLTDAQPNAFATIEIYINTTSSFISNLLVGNTNVESTLTMSGIVTAATQSNPALITSPNHGLLTGDTVTFGDVGGMVELNGNFYTIEFEDINSFTLDGIDSTAFTPYTFGGVWSQTNFRFYVPGSDYCWHRFYATATGQFISLVITYDDELMSREQIHESDFVMNAMVPYVRAAGKNIF